MVFMNYPPPKGSGFPLQIDYEFLLGGSRPLFVRIATRNFYDALGYRESFIRRHPKGAPNRFYHWKDVPMNHLSIIKELDGIMYD